MGISILIVDDDKLLVEKLEETVNWSGIGIDMVFTANNIRQAQKLLAAAVASVVGKNEERAVASLFSPGGTHAMKGEFAGSNDFEVLAFMVVLSDHKT